MLANNQTPQIVRDALNTMQMAFADVLGTDGHRRLYRALYKRSPGVYVKPCSLSLSMGEPQRDLLR